MYWPDLQLPPINLWNVPKMNTRVFEVITEGDCIKVWLPPVNHPEGDMVLHVQTSLIPALVAALKNYEDKT